MGLAAATVTVKLKDSDGQETSRSYEARLVGVTDAQAITMADRLQALTQLEVTDVVITRRVVGFAPVAAEVNSAVAETASLRIELGDGGFHSMNLPAMNAAFKSGKTIIGSDAAVQLFLSQFDNADGAAVSQGDFFVSDGETLSEIFIENGNVEGVVNR